MTLDFIRPGTLGGAELRTDNAVIEAFNSRFRQECLNEHWFLSMADAQELVDAWREDYNRVRPHSSLDNMTPEEFSSSRRSTLPPWGEQGSNGTAKTAQRQQQDICLTG